MLKIAEAWLTWATADQAAALKPSTFALPAHFLTTLPITERRPRRL